MNLGGTEKAFLGTLSQYTPELGYEVHCALLEKKGDLLPYIPSYVHAHEIKEYVQNKEIINAPLLVSIKESLRNGRILQSLSLIFYLVIGKIIKTDYFLLHSLFKKVNPFPCEFDTAVAYSAFSFPALYVAEKVKAKEKWLWIHYDVSKNGGINEFFARKVYNNYDIINVVSKEAKMSFDNRFPQFSAKTKLCYNIVPQKQIKLLADEYDTPEFIGCDLRLCTVGRISKEKGQDIALKALSILKVKGLNIKWVFVGGGSSFFDYCKQLSDEMDLNEEAVFLGPLINPYPYIKNCDVYIQPSLNEGYCISLAEARVFNKPIVSTDFAGAHEQLSHYGNPYEIVLQSPEDLSDAIIRVTNEISLNNYPRI